MPASQTRPLPNYESNPLRSDEIVVAAVQSISRPVDGKNPAKGRRENLEHLLDLIEAAQGWGPRKDLLVFHEFAISGWSHSWDRQDCMNVAIEVPGEETEIIGEKARKYNCYLHFGAYARDKDWPGHFVNMGVLIGPGGQVISKQWKSRNIYGFFGNLALMGTTIYDVLDDYVERYGVEALWPVARTDIGNIATTPCLFEPEIARAFAVQGAEILIRRGTAIGGEPTRVDLRAQCMANGLYGLLVNQAVSPGKEYLEDTGAGWSTVIDNRGQVLSEASSVHETLVTATLPIAAYRKKHSIPILTKELYEPMFSRYQSKYPPNMFSQAIPQSLAEAGDYLAKQVRW